MGLAVTTRALFVSTAMIWKSSYHLVVESEKLATLRLMRPLRLWSPRYVGVRCVTILARPAIATVTKVQLGSAAARMLAKRFYLARHTIFMRDGTFNCFCVVAVDDATSRVGSLAVESTYLVTMQHSRAFVCTLIRYALLSYRCPFRRANILIILCVQ